MSRLWTWGALSTNPFVDFSTTRIEPLIQHAVDVIRKIEPDLLYTLGYIAVIGVAYLFHSPFRAHCTAATDTYGRVTKFFQTWSSVVFFCFHLGPQLFRSKQSQIEQTCSEDEAVTILYFPLFIMFTVFFSFLHKMKRRWCMGVTYGCRLSVIGLNSLTLAAVGTVHYAYCSSLYQSSSNRLLRMFLYSLTPAPVLEHSFRCVAKLFFLSCCFVAADYQYKKWHDFDPSRGILWSELYELRRHTCDAMTAEETNPASVRQDWRELVAPPRVYAPTALAASNPIRLFAQHRKPGTSSGPAFDHEGDTMVNASDESYTEPTMPNTVTTTPFAPPFSLRSRVLYHECPSDANMSQLESWFDVDDAALKRVCGNSNAAAAPLLSPISQPGSFASTCAGDDAPATTPYSPNGSTESAARDADHADSTLTRLMSFRSSRSFLQEAREAQHPVNRPGMVPWWSTFVLFTVWQTLAGSMLRFLAFDVRTIQGFTTPKVFHLHFSSSLKRCVVNSLPPTMLYNAAAPAPPEDQSSTSGAEEKDKDTDPRSNCGGSLEKKSALDKVEVPIPTADEEDKPDVWFDWIADVGDGFNPTYAMARLLAQPTLQLPIVSAKRPRRPHRTSGRKPASEYTRADSELMHPASKMDASALTNPEDAMAQTVPLFSSPVSPFLAKARSFAETTRKAQEEDEEEGDSASGEDRSEEGDATSPQTPLTPLPFLPLHTADKEVSWSLKGQASANDEHGYSVGSLKAVSASYSCFAPQGHTTSTGSYHSKTTKSKALRRVEKGGVATLPRGSFVVIGGDLAYPSPDDETYTTRLFEPYNDALSGCVRLQSVFHSEQQRIVVADLQNIDVAHLNMLDAQAVADIARGRGGLREGRGTAEEALRSMPLLFAIPGNHDWFDGLGTYRKYILEKTWIGGWLMPQRSSFFVLRLPYNWFILCCDTGNTQDIDASQRNYFLDVIERYMDAESCVILTAHEPGWLLDAMEREGKPRQPELNRVVEVLGTRLRLHLAGDIHNYSRHVPTDPSSEAAMLIVSGGGGAFLHGSRQDRIISQGTRYVRACAFPSRTTFTNMAARLWGFRVVNWKFDMVVGFLCFFILLSVLPLTVDMEVEGVSSQGKVVGPVRLAQLFSLWVAYSTKITSHVITKGVISFMPLMFLWMCFSSAGSDRRAKLRWRLCYGAAWTFAVLLCCSGVMAFLHVQILYLMDHGFLYSAEGKWSSVLESQMKVICETFFTHARQILGGDSRILSRALGSLQDYIAQTGPMRWMLVVLRCCDPFETFSFFSTKVSSGTMGVFADDVSRAQILIYYLYVLFFYWIVVTPIVSMLIGTFLLISVTSFDYMYDATYSAFQIEDYKHFIRFRLDAKTRQLHAYVIAMQKPAKVYELDRRFLRSLRGAGLEEHRPPHLKQYPSRWAPTQNDRRCMKSQPELLEHFTVRPHRVPQSS